MSLDSIAMAGPFRNYKPTPVPTISNQPTTPLHEALEIYERFICKDIPTDLAKDAIFPTFLTVLSPPQIQQFLSITQEYELEKNYSDRTGLFLTHLVQLSHNAGNTQFMLDHTDHKPLNYLCSSMRKNQDKGLSVIIKGTIGNICFYGCKGGTYFIDKVSNSHVAVVAESTEFYLRDVPTQVGLFADSLIIKTYNPLVESKVHRHHSDGKVFNLISKEAWQQAWDEKMEIFARCRL